jgi:hypothetical protein
MRIASAPRSFGGFWRALGVGMLIATVVAYADVARAYLMLRVGTAPPGPGVFFRAADFPPGMPMPRDLFDRRGWVIAYGYPFGSWATYYLGASKAQPAVVIGLPTGTEFSIIPWRPRFGIPLLPGPGLVLDAALYGGAWALARLIQARRRARRGRCLSCGYGPWNNVGVCPECGEPRRARAACTTSNAED